MHKNIIDTKQVKNQSSPLDNRLRPIIKWPGGKENELSHIKLNAPQWFENYYEPFVGGGSVYTAFNCNHLFINDKSSELIALYQYIAVQDELFFKWLEYILQAWNSTLAFVDKNRQLCSFYKLFRDDEIDENDIRNQLHLFIETESHNIDSLLPIDFSQKRSLFQKELINNLVHKTMRMKKLEKERHRMPEQDIFSNIETAFTSALYTYLRTLYNDKKLCKESPYLATALFVFLRNYAYSGMFRYNNKGEFNVPYGGISYNHKLMQTKLDYYRSPELLEHIKKTTITNLDFLDFFHQYPPTEKDFVFLDPPYDTEFSTYAQNEFTHADQQRLANYLCNECQAKWQLVIKYTPFIYNLYNREGIVIKKFDKKYLVSFMNRNDKDVEHLIIMNYKNTID